MHVLSFTDTLKYLLQYIFIADSGYLLSIGETFIFQFTAWSNIRQFILNKFSEVINSGF